MEKRDLGNTGIAVTRIGMGVKAVGPSRHARAFADGARVIRYAMEQGIGFLDTDEAGLDYRYMSKALSDLAPEFSQNVLPRPVIAGKSSARGYEDMRRAIDACRAVLDLDRIDIFMLKDVVQPPDFAGRSGAWECLGDAKAKGHIAAAGISTSHIDAVCEAAEVPGMDAVFPCANLNGIGVRKGDGAGEMEAMESAIAKASESGAGVCATHVLGGGGLAAEAYAEALGYAEGLKGVTGIIVGMGCKQDIDDAVSYAAGRLPEGYRPLPSMLKARNLMFVDKSRCIKCGGCVKYCTYFTFSLGEDGFPVPDTNKCIRCGFCLPACPVQALMFL